MINEEILNIYFSQGLSKGLGSTDDRVCLQAAIVLALGKSLSDQPICISSVDRAFWVSIYNSTWSSLETRTAALRPAVLPQLGTGGRDRIAWVRAVVLGIVRDVIPPVLKTMEHIVLRGYTQALRTAANRCTEAIDLATAETAATEAMITIIEAVTAFDLAEDVEARAWTKAAETQANTNMARAITASAWREKQKETQTAEAWTAIVAEGRAAAMVELEETGVLAAEEAATAEAMTWNTTREALWAAADATEAVAYAVRETAKPTHTERGARAAAIAIEAAARAFRAAVEANGPRNMLRRMDPKTASECDQIFRTAVQIGLRAYEQTTEQP